MRERVVFFFGAGAEISYGMPSGGEFALEIFKELAKGDKNWLRQEIDNTYDSRKEWFPKRNITKRISIFGRSNLENIISSTLEANSDSLKEIFLHFDGIASQVKDNLFIKENIDIDKRLKEIGVDFDGIDINKSIMIHHKLISKDIDIFKSKYLVSLFELLNREVFKKQREKAIEIGRFFYEMIIGTFGYDLLKTLNTNIVIPCKGREKEYEKILANLPFLNDIGDIFNLDYKKVGLDFFIKDIENKFNILESKDAESEVLKFYLKIAERILSDNLDYQSLTDSYYRYLYQPQKAWGKFCKIVTFLNAIRCVMLRSLKNLNNSEDNTNNYSKDSYYEDIREAELPIVAIGTTNYTNLARRTGIKDLYHLNGSLDEYYDPYKNEVIKKDSNINSSFKVPLLIPQSLLRPITGISMMRRYIDFYDKCCESERLIVLGYGFNKYDDYINTLFRSLIDDKNMTIDIIVYSGEECKDKGIKDVKNKDDIIRNIRCDKYSNINFYPIDKDRNIFDRYWIDVLFTK